MFCVWSSAAVKAEKRLRHQAYSLIPYRRHTTYGNRRWLLLYTWATKTRPSTRVHGLHLHMHLSSHSPSRDQPSARTNKLAGNRWLRAGRAMPSLDEGWYGSILGTPRRHVPGSMGSPTRGGGGSNATSGINDVPRGTCTPRDKSSTTLLMTSAWSNQI